MLENNSLNLVQENKKVRNFLMQKIKDQLIQKLYKYGLSKTGYIVLLDLIQASDEKGKVQIYYKDIVNLVGCSNSQFYNIINDLTELGLIECRKNDRFKAEIDITINNNDFIDNYSNYVNININFFYNRQYARLNAGQIRVFLYFLFRIMKQQYKEEETKKTHKEKNKLFYNNNNSYFKIAKQLEIYTTQGDPNVRMVKMYCKELKNMKIISIGTEIDVNKKPYDIITISKEVLKTPIHTVTEKGKQEEQKVGNMHLHFLYFVKNLCRRCKISADKKNLEDTATIINQYKKIAEKKDKNIYRIMSNAIKELKEEILDSKKIHYIIKTLINKNYNENIIAY